MAQPPVTLIDEYSVSSLYLELRSNGKPISNATGFTFDFNGKLYLVSNWHVFSGRDPATGQPLSSHGAVPDELMVLLPGMTLGSWKPHLVKLYGDDGIVHWKQHATGQIVDIAAIELQIPTGQTHYSINSRKSNNSMTIGIAQELFIIGFPFGLLTGGALPIWKKASVASEPNFNPGQKRIIFVDTASRSGMSGSPVIARRTDSFVNEGRNMTLRPGPQVKFVGVYSGRLGAGEMQSQLGIVWKSELVDEVLSSGAPGNYSVHS